MEDGTSLLCDVLPFEINNENQFYVKMGIWFKSCTDFTFYLF